MLSFGTSIANSQNNSATAGERALRVRGSVMEFTGWSLNRECNEYWEYTFGSDIKKVIIVEDDPDSARYLETLINRIYPEALILMANSPREARDLFNSAPCDLAIVDFILSDTETGLDLCQEIHQRWPDAKLLIVSSISSYQFYDLAEFAHTVPDFIEKPLTADKLRQHLNQ
jgi:DNA-binding NtrC family response regulator